MNDLVDRAIVDWWNERPECRTKPERNGIPEGDAQVADREAKGETPDSPKRPPKQRIEDAVVRCRTQHQEKIWNEYAGENNRRDNPCREALNQPIDLPGPALDTAKGDEVRRGGESSDPVIN